MLIGQRRAAKEAVNKFVPAARDLLNNLRVRPFLNENDYVLHRLVKGHGNLLQCPFDQRLELGAMHALPVGDAAVVLVVVFPSQLFLVLGLYGNLALIHLKS